MNTQTHFNFSTRPFIDELKAADKDHIRRLNASKERLLANGDYSAYLRALKTMKVYSK